jgi:phospholipid transport system substrate-binding protein
MPLGVLTRRKSLLGAFAAFAGPVIPARSDTAPVESIQQLADGLLQIMKAGSATPFPARFDMLAPLVDRVFDLDVVLRTSVGSAWVSLPPSQQDLLRPAFRRYTIASYVNSFDHFNGQRFSVEPQTQPLGNDEQIVRTRIIPPSGDGHELNYVMRNTGSGWRAVDVLADGTISRVAVQRSDFRRLLSRGGAPALAESLATKSLGLSDGMS